MNLRNVTTTILMIIGLLAVLALVVFAFWAATDRDRDVLSDQDLGQNQFPQDRTNDQREAIESDFEERLNRLSNQIDDLQRFHLKTDAAIDHLEALYLQAKANFQGSASSLFLMTTSFVFL